MPERAPCLRPCTTQGLPCGTLTQQAVQLLCRCLHGELSGNMLITACAWFEELTVTGCMQRLLDKHLDVLLADAPRRSVLFIDSSKVGADGGCAHC